MTGDYQTRQVQVDDIIQNTRCTVPVAEPVVWITPYRVAVVFICRKCAAPAHPGAAARIGRARHPPSTENDHHRHPHLIRPPPLRRRCSDAAAEIIGRRTLG
jgi:hypothetical protein